MVSALNVVQCCGTVGSVTATISDPHRFVSLILKGSFLEQVEQETKRNRLVQVYVENGWKNRGGSGEIFNVTRIFIVNSQGHHHKAQAGKAS